jgi:hypothetical protein
MPCADFAAAFPSFPASPAAATLDRDLLALVLRTKATARELAAAEAAFAAARERLASPAIPAALTWRDRDRAMFPRIDCAVGDPLALLDVQILRAARDAIHDLARIMGDLPSRETMEALGRAAEIDAAAGEYFERLDAARRAAGFHEAEAEFDRLDGDLGRLWRAIAFTPARTLLGVIAKLDAVADSLAAAPLAPGDFPERCAAADVAYMAAADLAALFAAPPNGAPAGALAVFAAIGRQVVATRGDGLDLAEPRLR